VAAFSCSKLHRVAPQVAWSADALGPVRNLLRDRRPAGAGYDRMAETVGPWRWRRLRHAGGGPTSLINGAAMPELASRPLDRGPDRSEATPCGDGVGRCNGNRVRRSAISAR